jgi:hypothetical protein
MKRVLIPIFVLLSIVSYSQVVFENSYAGNWRMYLEKVDDEGFKYVSVNDATKRVVLYNLDHTIWKDINAGIPSTATILYTAPFYASKTLFNSDSKIEVFVCYADGSGYIGKIVNEDGVVLNTFSNVAWHNIKNTDGGCKLLIHKNPASGSVQYTEVYGLPGQYAGIQKPGKDDTETGLYPNPVQEAATLTYTLPAGVNAAQVLVYNASGQQVRSYQVSNQFSSIIISRGDLPPGSYVYSLQVPGSKPVAKQFVIQ